MVRPSEALAALWVEADVVAAARAAVPEAGERQDRAVDYAVWHLAAWKRGDVAYPPPRTFLADPWGRTSPVPSVSPRLRPSDVAAQNPGKS